MSFSKTALVRCAQICLQLRQSQPILPAAAFLGHAPRKRLRYRRDLTRLPPDHHLLLSRILIAPQLRVAEQGVGGLAGIEYDVVHRGLKIRVTEVEGGGLQGIEEEPAFLVSSSPAMVMRMICMRAT
jgi:hypothetical protein